MLSLAMIVGFIVVVQFFFPTAPGQTGMTELTYMSSILAIFLTISGSVQLFKYHIPIVMKKEPYWQVNAWTMFWCVLTVVLSLTLGVNSELVNKVFNIGIMSILYNALYAAMSWIIVTMLMRYVSFRNLELTLFTAAIICVIIVSTPILIIPAPGLYDAGYWLRTNIAGSANLALAE